jgi:hypothetical protein
MELWEEIKKLEGDMLENMTNDGYFEILSVSDNLITIKLQHLGKERTIRRNEIE